ncbi:OLC1v1012950C2 [Oldenlandia corymbosa var. corymbosa]|nr:OLC1v1012950C2 [Oldenlandia corymbosa var. corymbosa]
MEKLEIRPRGEEENHGLHIHHYSDSESPSNSPMSHNGSILGGNDSGTTFTGSSRSSVSSSRSSSSSRSGGSCSGSMSEEDEEGDDECLDDWETVADALAATEEKHKPDDHSLDTDTASESKDVAHGDSHPDDATGAAPDDDLKAKPENGISLDRSTVKCRAWRPDDVFRPQSLPNLSKQYSFPMNPERYFGCGGSVWGCKNVRPAPTSCPICYEDLDYTDSSFIPCSCGFKLCLFCHKRILEEDGRCPGCRQQYKNESGKVETLLDGNSLAFRLARSCSMVTRS